MLRAPDECGEFLCKGRDLQNRIKVQHELRLAIMTFVVLAIMVEVYPY